MASIHTLSASDLRYRARPPKLSSRLLAICGIRPVQFGFQIGVLLLQLFDLHLEVLHLLTRTNTHFLDNFNETPETKYDDKRSDLFDDASRQDIDQEADNNNQGIKYVEPRVEISERLL